ncbi:hypothetical protein Oter_2532 [Opitutus terrae PB90-1]|uniref:Uncharacterized protein n=1 Tax=Opitutus terrae (strain DSM 11246 / JCM 15787 / PB90-1) TaxID=452637 RepID=B1ZT25_OPITP|nr:hypothetical protein Oter_2532 [Opitutus terrae PB90-1]
MGQRKLELERFGHGAPEDLRCITYMIPKAIVNVADDPHD